MKKMIVILVFFQMYFIAFGQNKLAINVGVNSWYPFGGAPTIKNCFFNARTDIQYAYNNKFGMSIGYNFKYLKKRNPDNPYTINLSDLNLNIYYSLDVKRKHTFSHGLGVYIYHNLKDTQVSTLIDDPFYLSLNMYSDPNEELDPEQYGLLKKMPIFIETGYKFYVLDNFYLGVSGRASVIRYETPVSDVIPNEIDSKLGFSYSIYYGLGYTFGREE